MDKVQKIREEVVRMHNLLPVVDGYNIYLNYADRICTTLEKYIDSLQEEPVSIWHDASKKSDNPEDVVIINPSDNTGEVLTKCTGVNQGHIWAYTSELLKLDNPCNIGKNLQEPQVKKSAEIERDKGMCKENGNSLTQEPANEDLEKAAVEAFKQIVDSDKNNFLEIFKAGAKWQAEQFEKNRLAACDRQAEEEAEIERDFVMGIIENEHRQPTFDDAIKYGMRLQKEQMMAKAIDGEIGYWNIRGLSVNTKLPRTLKEDDRVKLIIIKQD